MLDVTPLLLFGSLLAAWLLDRVLGEPTHWHPLVGFGHVANRIERICRPKQQPHGGKSLFAGCVAVVLAIVPITLIFAGFLSLLPAILASAAGAVILYSAIAARSLAEHAEAVHAALQANDLPHARTQLARIVSRDTSSLNDEQIAAATIESVLENGNDSIFAAFFWFAVGGPVATVAYRLSNTLDAMWGYKNQRYIKFGWAAARFDDLLNFVPAKLTALSYALLGNTSTALSSWYQQGRHWKSPNAGPVMAAGAASLGLQLGGVANYHGKEQQRPALGRGRAANADDIPRAIALINRSIMLWLGLILGLSLLSASFG